MLQTIVLTLLGLLFVGNAAIEGGIHIAFEDSKKGVPGKQFDILLSFLLSIIFLIWGYIQGIHYFKKEDLFVGMISITIAVYIITRTYVAKL